MFNAKKTDIVELKAIIEDGIKKVLEDGKFKEYLDFHSQFSRYSLTNSLLIFAACPYATIIAGRKKWAELGRTIIDGVEPIMIFAPMIKKFTEEVVDEETGEIVTKERSRLKGFCGVDVFDVSQTEGKELPEAKSLCRDFGSSTELLARYIEVFGDKYKVRQEPLNAAIGGFITSDKTITLNAAKSEEQRLKTLIHEVAHGELGHFTDGEKPTDIKELEAEITAYVVSKHFGVDASDFSFGYLLSWSQGRLDKVHTALNSAYAVSSSIIDTIENAETQQMAS